MRAVLRPKEERRNREKHQQGNPKKGQTCRSLRICRVMGVMVHTLLLDKQLYKSTKHAVLHSGHTHDQHGLMHEAMGLRAALSVGLNLTPA
jgi:hypothetical protein